MNDPEDQVATSPVEPASATNKATSQLDDLHDLFQTPAPDVEDPLAHLRDDPNYSALIRDLEYIAREARKLFEPASDTPSDSVWDNIQRELGKDEPKH